MIARPEWAHLIPHAGAMCLLDAVTGWDATRLHARSTSHRRRDHPLCADGVLHAVSLCEYAAQAMAVHGALVARAAGDPVQAGFLAALRDVELHIARIDDLPGTLQVHVERLLAMAGGLHYAFRVDHRGDVLATGRATVMLRGA